MEIEARSSRSAPLTPATRTTGTPRRLVRPSASPGASRRRAEDGATLLSVTVNYRDPEILAPNMWIRVQGKVRPGEHEGEPVPVIDASGCSRSMPENPILPYGSEMGGHDHDHDHDHAGHAHRRAATTRNSSTKARRVRLRKRVSALQAPSGLWRLR